MVEFAPMDPSEFEPYLERLLASYAEEHIRTGRWTREEGPAEARKEVTHLLPQGLKTPNQYLFSVRDGADRVGLLWLAIEPRGGFVYDIEIFEAFRRRGFAREAMRYAEKVAGEKGAKSISLHVFGSNTAARRLYDGLGYQETNVIMSKSLGGAAKH